MSVTVLAGALAVLVGVVNVACRPTPAPPPQPTPVVLIPTEMPAYPVATALPPADIEPYPAATALPPGPEEAYPAATLVPPPSPTLAPTETPMPPFTPTGRFGEVWEELGGPDADIGLAIGEVADVDGADQVFENGCMIWVNTEPRRIFVLSDAETSLQTSNTCANESEEAAWQGYFDTWEEPQPEVDPPLTAPANLRQPIRGFGKVWSQNPDVRDELGWARLKEKGSPGQFQQFEHGVMVWTSNMVRAFVLYEDGEKAGKWESFQAP